MLLVLSVGLHGATGLSHYHHPYAQTQHLSSAQEDMGCGCQQLWAGAEPSLLLATPGCMLLGYREEEKVTLPASNEH